MSQYCIRNVEWAVTWDEELGEHVYSRDVDIAFSDSGIEFVGPAYPETATHEMSGSRKMVMPGLVDVHSHPAMQPLFRGYTEEFGNPRLFNSGRHLFRQAFNSDEDAQRASAEYAIAELLCGGVTTIVDLSHPYDGWLDILDKSAVRACVAPMYRSARWYTDTGQETKYEWDIEGGKRAFEEAVRMMDQADGHSSGRFFSMVAPAQVDTCTADLLKESMALAQSSDRPLHVHASQSYAEFNGMTRRNNMTPVEWLDSLGLLTSRTILGHAVFTDEHPWLIWPTRRDLGLIAESGTSIAHCPTPFARDGTVMHDLGTYARRGINFGVGTDTHPHNLLEEMKWAEILARVAAGPTHDVNTATLFHFATVGGANALGRHDIGRLAPGCKADLAVIDLTHPGMQPLADPLRSLIYGAADRAVRDVFVDGTHVVRDGTVATLDREQATRELEAGQRRAAERVPQRDQLGRTVEDLMPLTLRVRS